MRLDVHCALYDGVCLDVLACLFGRVCACPQSLYQLSPQNGPERLSLIEAGVDFPGGGEGGEGE